MNGERSWAEIAIACLRVCSKEIVPTRYPTFIVSCSHSIRVSDCMGYVCAVSVESLSEIPEILKSIAIPSLGLIVSQ